MLIPQSRPHERLDRRFAIQNLDDVLKVEVPTTEEGWAKLARFKKIDMNDIVHELNPYGKKSKSQIQREMFDWLDRTPTINLGGQPGMIVSAADIVQCYPENREEVICDLLRVGETLNIVAAPKSNKSWLTLDMAMNVVSGGRVFGKFECRKRGRVLIVDNELHCEVIASRLKLVADAMNVPRSLAFSMIDYIPLRGKLIDIHSLAGILQNVRPGFYSLIILDAFYKFYPPDFDENSNSEMARLYNVLDHYADCLRVAQVLIHHFSKGNQAGKNVTDMGAGAGAQSRACDSHLAIRPHETDGVFVIDVANRSFAPQKPFCCRFKFPIWVEDKNSDASALAGAAQPKRGPGRPGASEDTVKWRSEEILRIEKFIADVVKEPMSVAEILTAGEDRGFRPWNRDRMKILIPTLLKSRRLTMASEHHGKVAAKYICVPQPESVPTSKDNENQPEQHQSEQEHCDGDQNNDPELNLGPHESDDSGEADRMDWGDDES